MRPQSRNNTTGKLGGLEVGKGTREVQPKIPRDKKKDPLLSSAQQHLNPDKKAGFILMCNLSARTEVKQSHTMEPLGPIRQLTLGTVLPQGCGRISPELDPSTQGKSNKVQAVLSLP